jgi:hypothetical protein
MFVCYCIFCTSRNDKVKFLYISCISRAFSLHFPTQENSLLSMSECEHITIIIRNSWSIRSWTEPYQFLLSHASSGVCSLWLKIPRQETVRKFYRMIQSQCPFNWKHWAIGQKAKIIIPFELKKSHHISFSYPHTVLEHVHDTLG